MFSMINVFFKKKFKTFFYQKLNKISYVQNFSSTLGFAYLIINIFLLFGIIKFEKLNEYKWFGLIILFFISFIISFSIIFYKNSKTKFIFKFKNIDSSVQLEINDFFYIQGIKIIPTNTSFDTSIENIMESTKSIQHFFQTNYYPDLDSLDDLIEKSIIKNNIKEININNKKKGKSKIYPIGTIVPLKDNYKKNDFYLLAHSNVNNNGNVESKIEYLDESLLTLWEFLSEHGKFKDYVIPLIGTGRCRLNITRNEIIKKIIETFIVGISAKKFTEKLIICIHPDDLKNVDLDNILEFLDYKTKFFE